MLHLDDRVRAMTMHAALVESQERWERVQALELQREQERKRKRQGQEEEEDDGDGDDNSARYTIRSNHGEGAAGVQGQIQCRVYVEGPVAAMGAFVRFDLSLRCGSSGVICFVRPA